MSYKLVIKDAFWQILGRIFSAIWWFIVIKLISPYLWPLRFGDYSTILKYFAIWSALADFWLYVVALREIWKLKNNSSNETEEKSKLSEYYSKFVTSRFVNVIVVYGLALLVAYFIPSYTSNPYLIYWLPLWMLFSASFMMAWIIQIPLQLYWKMEQLSIGLIVARLAQIIILIWLIIMFPKFVSDGSVLSIWIFITILVSVVASWVVQWIYVYFVWRKYLPFKWIFDWSFTKGHIIKNLRYWLAYYLSSFHTLVVLILLSIFYPTTEWFTYVWIWAVWLALIEILLIVPSSLGNSIIHKISWYTLEEKTKSFGYLMTFIIWIWMVFLINFDIFDKSIIYFVAWEKYLTTWSQIWADYILPFLAFVLLLSFIKQIFNYLFVATDLQNKLFNINLFGVLIWVSVWLPFIIKYNLIWWIITQTLLEILFVIWAIFISYKNKVFPKIEWKYFFIIIWTMICILWLWYIIEFDYKNFWMLLVAWTITNLVILLASYKPIKYIVKKL